MTTLSNPTRVARKVCFQHMRTGRIITAPSVAAFARKARLGPYGKYHFDEVLKGRRLHHSGWGVPERLNQELTAKDVFGNQISGTIADLSRRMSSRMLTKLANGKSCRGILPGDFDTSKTLPPRPYNVVGYALKKRLSNGGTRIVFGRTLEQAGERAGINPLSVFNLVHGYATEVKGVTLKKVYTVRRSAIPKVQR